MSSHHDISRPPAGRTRADREAYVRGLPPTPAPAGAYVPVTEAGALAFTAGHTHAVRGALGHRGPVGAPGGPDRETARSCAALAVRNCLASLAHHLGGLDRVVRVVAMTGYVAAAPGFTEHPAVLDGASEELLEAFGEDGRPSRAAVGVSSLPGGAVVEVSLVVALAP
ncbi:RidA family protein [Kocuria flava]|uniref:RidA family protein n=1 Tax=Kocuria flava TaxID=446860 RepID=UPI001FF2B4E4|nr:RidA family protein [Kocuria flava]MCJ8504734.1 RidA family protein [Kocuria flava]